MSGRATRPSTWYEPVCGNCAWWREEDWWGETAELPDYGEPGDGYGDCMHVLGGPFGWKRTTWWSTPPCAVWECRDKKEHAA